MTKNGETKTKPKVKRRGAIPPRTDLDWDLIESYYIQGEIVREGHRGHLTRRKPSFADVARKFKCSSSLVGYQSKRRKWKEKRDTWERQAAKIIADEVHKARALSFAEAASILDSWLIQFQKQLEEQKVRTDNLSDFNVAMRLKRFIEDQGSAGAEQKSAVTLEDLERKHRRLRETAEAERDAMSGALGGEYEGDGAGDV